MTGIVSILYEKGKKPLDKIPIIENSSILQHRGMKSQRHYVKNDVFLSVYGKQSELIPNDLYIDANSGAFLALDGRIYNSNAIIQKYQLNRSNSMRNNEKSDAELLYTGFQQKGIDIFKDVVGSYSGILWDGIELIGFKDPVGAKPLYYCQTSEFVAFASEMKALTPLRKTIFPVDPGYIISSMHRRLKFFDFTLLTSPLIKKNTEEFYAHQLRALIIKVILDNIHPSEHITAFLSGGIDSAIITAIAKNYIKNLHVYSVGVEGSRDIYFARLFAKRYGLDHTVIEINFDDLLHIVPEVVYSLESFDTALIRSAVPMYILSKHMNEREHPDVVLTGEGGDELFGGYDYLKQLSDEEQLKKELYDLLKIEHKTGLQRVDRIPYRFSIEARAPLFDRRLVEFALQIPPSLKMKTMKGKKIEKYILRKAFESELPEEIIWRKKEKFSQGAGSGFLLRDYFQTQISDDEFELKRHVTPSLVLRSKEELYYWKIFNKEFHPVPETLAQIGRTTSFIE